MISNTGQIKSQMESQHYDPFSLGVQTEAYAQSKGLWRRGKETEGKDRERWEDEEVRGHGNGMF